MDTLMIDFKKLIKSYRTLIFRFQFYRIAHRLRYEENKKILSKDNINSKIGIKVCLLSIGLILVIISIMIYVENILIYYEFH